MATNIHVTNHTCINETIETFHVIPESLDSPLIAAYPGFKLVVRIARGKYHISKTADTRVAAVKGLFSSVCINPSILSIKRIVMRVRDVRFTELSEIDEMPF